MSNINKQALRERAESTIGILENIAGFEPSDIDGDAVELRFETEGGFDTGCDVSIVEQCQKAADVVRALLDELEAADALNKHLELAIRKAEGCSEALRRKAEAAESRVDELEAREVKLPDYTEIYQDEFAKEVEHQVRVALNSAGISIKGGRDMAEFTKQFMKDIISGNGFGVAPSAVVEMARQLLSSMEQEPVGITDKSEIEGLKRGEMANVMPPDFKGIDAGDEVLLYAAPQLPQPAVQNMHHDAKCDLFRPQVVNGVFVPRHCDCSAATLQGAEPISQPFTLREGLAEIRNLGPIDAEKIQAERDALNEPVQGWIPCSERMPPCFTGVIVAAPWPSAPDGYAMKWATNCPCHPDADENGWLIPGASWKPTHWMPLPAAPQQEVK